MTCFEVLVLFWRKREKRRERGKKRGQKLMFFSFFFPKKESENREPHVSFSLSPLSENRNSPLRAAAAAVPGNGGGMRQRPVLMKRKRTGKSGKGDEFFFFSPCLLRETFPSLSLSLSLSRNFSRATYLLLLLLEEPLLLLLLLVVMVVGRRRWRLQRHVCPMLRKGKRRGRERSRRS